MTTIALDPIRPRGETPGARGVARWPLLALAMLGGTALWYFERTRPSSLLDPDAAPRPVETRDELTAEEKRTIEIFRRASPAVVHITTHAVRRELFRLNVLEIPQEGTGSGFVWDEDGHVVTNYHVLLEAEAAKVTLADRSSWQARLVGYAKNQDLAVLKIDAPRQRLRPLPIGSSSDLQVGQEVLAIGNPFGLDQSLTTGVISALERSIPSVTGRPIGGAIQTDAAINPGNSGGPLLDSAGRLIGVNASILAPAGTYAGIGFAIPVDTVNRIVPQLIRRGRYAQAGLGIYPAKDSDVRDAGVQGVVVRWVAPEGAAARAGMRGIQEDRFGDPLLGDVIVAIDGRRVATTNDLFRILDEHEVGDRVTVTVEREGKKVELPVTLQAIDS